MAPGDLASVMDRRDGPGRLSRARSDGLVRYLGWSRRP